MRFSFSLVVFGFLTILTPSLTGAQDLPSIQEAPSASPTTDAPQSRKKIVYREKSYFEFEDTLINGNLRAPDGSFIFRKNQSSFSSALNLRRSFIPELKASSNDAR
jgi:hypothetical protein